MEAWKRKWRVLVIIIPIILSIAAYWFVFHFWYGPNPDLAQTVGRFFGTYQSEQSLNIASENLVSAQGDLSFLKIPEGFTMQVFAENLGGPNPWIPYTNGGVREITTSNGIVYATLLKDGKVVSLFDDNNDGRADRQEVFIENLVTPHGIDAYDGWIYIAETSQINRFRDDNADGKADENSRRFVADIPGGPEHFTRSVKILNDPASSNQPRLFLGIGSSCNACYEEAPRAVILRCEVDGTNCNTYAEGLRNSMDITVWNNRLYAPDVGKDLLGNDLPPDEVNLIEAEKQYGWPHCYGNRVLDTSFEQDLKGCEETQAPFAYLPAHSSPLGVEAYRGNTFPANWKDRLFVTLHGSYQARPPTGYSIVSVDQNGKLSQFVSGFIDEQGEVMGRPVGILNYKDGFLVADDMQGKIYFVRYQ